MKYVVLIPAYKPGHVLAELVRGLCAAGVGRIVIVDDGSGPSYQSIFDSLQERPEVILLGHAVNLGKGAAIKSGVEFILRNFGEPVMIVTADADGQHAAADILAVGEASCAAERSLVLGARKFAHWVPLRSRWGNQVTRVVMRMVVGQNLSDTQTGLRGIPPALQARLLALKSNGYEFELDVLLLAREMRIPIREHPIRTIYHALNASSHFNPLLDSMRIYFVLLRFLMASLATAGLDNVSFLIAYKAGAGLVASQGIARVAAILFNYPVVKRKVFRVAPSPEIAVLRYLLVVCLSASASIGLIQLLRNLSGVPVPQAKLLAETLLFLVNFIVLRDFVFRAKEADSAAMGTDWTEYYRKPFVLARFTRRYTRAAITRAISQYAGQDRPLVVAELGGANSCFLEALDSRFDIRQYHVFDTNSYGLSLLSTRTNCGAEVVVHQENVLRTPAAMSSDVVFSVGLIEHFDRQGTGSAIRSHLDRLRPGGVLILSYPTPTPLYRTVRFLAELFSCWKFPDERPLDLQEVARHLAPECDLQEVCTLWPLILTQQMVIATKRSSSEAARA